VVMVDIGGYIAVPNDQTVILIVGTGVVVHLPTLPFSPKPPQEGDQGTPTPPQGEGDDRRPGTRIGVEIGIGENGVTGSVTVEGGNLKGEATVSVPGGLQRGSITYESPIKIGGERCGTISVGWEYERGRGGRFIIRGGVTLSR